MRAFSKHFRDVFFLRHHMALILLSSGAAGVVASKYMMQLGLHLILIRLPLAIIISYGAFFLLLRLWLAYVRALYRPQSHYPSDDQDEESRRGTSPKQEQGGGWWDGSGLESLLDVGGDEGGCLLFILGIFVLVVIGAALLLIIEAPVVLAEAAFQFFMGVGLIKSFRRIDRPSWHGSVFKATWVPFLWVLSIALLMACWAQFRCPEASTLKEAIYCKTN